ncbi:hypothetical protein [Kribbella sp. NPDC049584]|uniref:hypothetical protein n=1 Tax=Kribbella sp. NPDC049584 TaxID=3154833 RepID=UPI00342B60EF
MDVPLEAGEERYAGLSRAAGEEQQNAAWGVDVVRRNDCEIKRLAAWSLAVERDVQRRTRKA